MDDSDDGDDHKEELRVEEDAEGVGDVCGGGALAYSMRGHKPENRDECGACEDVMDRVVFGDVYHTENPYQEGEDGDEGPPRLSCDTSLVFVYYCETGHNQHTRGDKVSRLEYGGSGGGVEQRFLTRDNTRYASSPVA